MLAVHALYHKNIQSNHFLITLNIIRSSVGGTIGAPCYIKERLVSSVPLVTSTSNKSKLVLYSVRMLYTTKITSL